MLLEIGGRIKTRWLVIAAIAAAAVAATGAANANHAAGTPYKGLNTGGGIVEFTVSKDGNSVLDFRYTALPELCSIEEQLEPGPVVIVNHTFSFEPADFMRFFGSFPSPGLATGTVTPKTIITSCGTLTWTADTSVGGIAELPEVAGTPLESAGSTGPSASLLAGLAAVAVGTLALSGAVWYARRRLR